jgi:hypothetical protein
MKQIVVIIVKHSLTHDNSRKMEQIGIVFWCCMGLAYGWVKKSYDWKDILH